MAGLRSFTAAALLAVVAADCGDDSATLNLALSGNLCDSDTVRIIASDGHPFGAPDVDLSTLHIAGISLINHDPLNIVGFFGLGFIDVSSPGVYTVTGDDENSGDCQVTASVTVPPCCPETAGAFRITREGSVCDGGVSTITIVDAVLDFAESFDLDALIVVKPSGFSETVTTDVNSGLNGKTFEADEAGVYTFTGTDGEGSCQIFGSIEVPQCCSEEVGVLRTTLSSDNLCTGNVDIEIGDDTSEGAAGFDFDSLVAVGPTGNRITSFTSSFLQRQLSVSEPGTYNFAAQSNDGSCTLGASVVVPPCCSEDVGALRLTRDGSLCDGSLTIEVGDDEFDFEAGFDFDSIVMVGPSGNSQQVTNANFMQRTVAVSEAGTYTFTAASNDGQCQLFGSIEVLPCCSESAGNLRAKIIDGNVCDGNDATIQLSDDLLDFQQGLDYTSITGVGPNGNRITSFSSSFMARTYDASEAGTYTFTGMSNDGSCTLTASVAVPPCCSEEVGPLRLTSNGASLCDADDVVITVGDDEFDGQTGFDFDTIVVVGPTGDSVEVETSSFGGLARNHVVTQAGMHTFTALSKDGECQLFGSIEVPACCQVQIGLSRQGSICKMPRYSSEVSSSDLHSQIVNNDVNRYNAQTLDSAVEDSLLNVGSDTLTGYSIRNRGPSAQGHVRLCISNDLEDINLASVRWSNGVQGERCIVTDEYGVYSVSAEEAGVPQCRSTASDTLSRLECRVEELRTLLQRFSD